MKEQSTIHLNGVNVVVTGAARGLGAALALALADQGCNVSLCGRSLSALDAVASHTASVPFYAAKHGQAALADGLRQMFLGTPVRSICIHPPWIKDIPPLDAEWEAVPSRTKAEMATNRDVVEAVIFAITRPRHVTIASLVMDSDFQGTDFRSHLKEQLYSSRLQIAPFQSMECAICDRGII